jgi:TolB-like protein/Flp pilus assembly protein TadD
MRSIAVFPFSHIERVAVSPFGHIERQEETARFARSLSESILEALLQVETGSIRRWGRLPFPVGKLKVASRTTSFALAGSGRDISEAADELGVGYVLEGSIQHLGDDLRITARLVRAADGFQVWSKSYDGAFDDRLEMQGVVASNVATVAADRVLWDIRRRYARWGALGLGTNRDAMGYYLAAENQKRLLQLGEGGDPGLQERLLRRAVGADPGFASAWTMLAGNYTMRTGGSLAPEDASRRAHDAIDRALALRPDDPEFQTHLGVIYWLLDLDYAAAEAVLERVLQQSPGIPWVQTALASIALCEGRVQDALQLTKAAMASGNTHTVLLNFHAWTFLIAGDYERALSVAREAWALTGHRPDAIRGVWGDGIPGLISQIMALVQLGRIAEARPLVEEGWKAEGESFPEIYFWLLAAIGEEARARQVLADIAPRLGLSSGYLALGDLDNTFRALRAEVENHDFHTISHLRAGRWWDEIRGDPRFDAVLALLESHETHTEKYLRAQQEAPITARGDARPSAGL